jgi:hypothetical protein
LKIPDEVPDEEAIYLSDILPTSYHNVVDTGVKEGDVVGVWGLGPVSLCKIEWISWSELIVRLRVFCLDRTMFDPVRFVSLLMPQDNPNSMSSFHILHQMGAFEGSQGSRCHRLRPRKAQDGRRSRPGQGQDPELQGGQQRRWNAQRVVPRWTRRVSHGFPLDEDDVGQY